MGIFKKNIPSRKNKYFYISVMSRSQCAVVLYFTLFHVYVFLSCIVVFLSLFAFIELYLNGLTYHISL
jgi:hypothetical protein